MFGRSLWRNKAEPTSVPLSEQSEETLLAAAVQFDDGALGELYDRYETKIYSYIYRRTGDATLAEDLTAQVFVKMLQAIREQKAWHSSFSGWLYRIAHNLVIDYYRQRDRQNQVSLDESLALTDDGADPIKNVASRIEAERLRNAIRQLTDEQAEVLSLRFLEGYSITEVATMMKKSEGAIKALQYRAVTTLRQLLEYSQVEPRGKS
jgi:RNA polymerase sigma-70 factor (ECF subfamily)